MPSITGTLDDNAIELVSQLLGNLSDLPFDAFFVDGQTLAVAAVTFTPGLQVQGTTWHPIDAQSWRFIESLGWVQVPGQPWREIR